jgi:hypothetical protein
MITHAAAVRALKEHTLKDGQRLDQGGWAAYRFGLSKPWYWFAIAICRIWGTDTGDMLVAFCRYEGASRPVALWHCNLGCAARRRYLLLDAAKRDIRNRTELEPSR